MAQVEVKRPVYKSISGFAFAFTRWHRALIPISLWFCLVALGLAAHGQVVANWTGKGHDSLWSNEKNWDTHLVPGSNDTANIDLSGSNLVILNTNLVIGTINLGGQGTNILDLTGVSIQCTGSISITNGGILEITGNSVVVGGSVQNFGSIMVPANLGTQSLTLMCNFGNSGLLDAETNSVLSLSGTSSGTNSYTPQLLTGTIFTGSGVVQFSAGNAKINCRGTMSVAGTVNVQQSISGSSTWVGPGLFQWLSGSISNVTFAPNLTVQLSTSGQKLVNGVCTNQGTMIWLLGADGFIPNANAEFFNTGLCQFENNCTLGSGTNGFFQNTGTLQVPPNLGTVSLMLQCGFTNYGAVDVESNSTFLVQRPLFILPMNATFESGTLFEGLGTLRFPTNSSGWANLGIVCHGTMIVNGTVELNVGQAGDAVWTGSGLLRWWGSPLFNPTFAPGFHVEISNSDPKAIVGTGTNLGTIRLIGGDFSFYGRTGNFYNQGVFQIESNCNFTSCLSNFNNSGTIILPSGLGTQYFAIDCPFTNYGIIDAETNSTLQLLNTNFPSFLTGTVFEGAGTIQIISELASDINCDGTLVVNGTLDFQAFQDGDPTWTGSGLLRFIGGQMNNVTFAPGFNVQLLSADDVKMFTGACTNHGTIRVLDDISLDSPDGGLFSNTGLFQIETNCSLSFVSFGSSISSFQNTGTIKIPPGLGELSFIIQCPFTNYGVIDVETNSTLDFNNTFALGLSTLDFESGTVFSGSVQFFPTGSFNCHGTITVDGTIIFNSSQSGDATWTGPGLLKFMSGGMVNDTFAPGFNVQLIGPESKSFQGCTNEGTIRVLGTGGLLSDSTPFNTGIFYNSGLIQLETNCDFVQLAGFQNVGTLRVPPAFGMQSLTLNCPFTNYGIIDVETNSTLSIVTSSFSTPLFETGTVFAGTGTVEFGPNGSFSSEGTITVDGTVEYSSYFLSIQGANTVWTGPGLLQFIGGGMAGVTFAPGFNVQLIGPDSKTLDGCTNEGTIRVLGTGTLASDPPILNSTGLFYNGGLIRIETNCDFFVYSGVQNIGTLKVPPGLGALSLTLNSFLTNSGVIDVETNSQLTISNGPYGSQTYLGGTIFDGSGTLSFAGAGNVGIACYGSITDNCALELQMNMSGASTWTGSGLFSWHDGVISSINFGPGFQAQISGPEAKFLTGICTNQGTLSWLGGGQLNDVMTSGQFYNSGTLQITTDGTWNNIPINNQVGGTFRQLAGTFSVASFTNMGSVQAVSGLLDVTTNFDSSAGSSYQVTVSGTTPGTNFNQLNSQSLTLNGSLQVLLTNGFSPSIGNSFPIMTGTRLGSFSSTALPAPQSNLMWHVQYAPASVALEVAQPFALTDLGFANGAFQFSLNGFASGSYDIQASSNLMDWTTILSNYPFSGSVTVTDTNTAEFGRRFYRARIFP